MDDARSLLPVVARAITPTVLGFFGVMMLALPLRLFEGTVPTPLFPLIVIFFWSIYGPGYVPTASTFLIGLLQDLLLGSPLGVWMIVYLLAQYLVISQRDYFIGRDQHVVWLGFGIVAFSAGAVVWGLTSLLEGIWVPVLPLTWQLVATVAFYPVIAIAFSHLHQRVIIER